ncbi:ParB N-terminal domain-containing protein [Paramuribaculum intestinale]|uniref:ParB N-terminal domain-containing protein n=1 Tax=Paramuribaculum intestinale TaxID=2094151 RepID=UPI0025AA098B|nr:ParB N-terminal domain-containing protein [Paramuribaculum intestinale]
MKIEKVKLTQVRTNAENPRTISKPKFQKLMDSILALPAMLEIRPVVVDHRMSALGGNMRLNALKEIAKMTVEQLAIRLHRLPEYQERGDAERQKLVEFWGEWLETPFVYIINAKHLTEHERKQFMIKDNVSFGTWDYDALANKWPAERLEAWGIDIWTGKPAEFAPLPGATTNGHTDDGDPGMTPTSHADGEADGQRIDPLAGLQDALPPELQGRELDPDHLENIKGDDLTPSEHVVITYAPDERQALADYLGVDAEKLYSKICWRLDELFEMMDETKTDEQEDREDEND